MPTNKDMDFVKIQAIVTLVCEAIRKDLINAGGTYGALLHSLMKHKPGRVEKMQEDTKRLVDKFAEIISSDSVDKLTVVLACISLAQVMIERLLEEIPNLKPSTVTNESTNNDGTPFSN